MPCRAPLSRLPRLLALALCLTCLSCSGDQALPALPVELPAGPPLTAPQQRQCEALLAALPGEIDPGVRRRDVVPDTGRTAAWGEPAVVLRCGAEPGNPDENPLGVNGVDWSVRDIGPGFRWTTFGRAVPVSVEIPDAYPNSAELVNPLATALLGALPAVSPSPSPGLP